MLLALAANAVSGLTASAVINPKLVKPELVVPTNVLALRGGATLGPLSANVSRIVALVAHWCES